VLAFAEPATRVSFASRRTELKSPTFRATASCATLGGGLRPTVYRVRSGTPIRLRVDGTDRPQKGRNTSQNQRALERARAELAAAAAKEQEKLAELERQLRDVDALEKARAELAASANKEQERLAGLVNRLETELSDAIDRKAKAIARAQLTRSGHVYVLSNMGSFGEGIYKIGLTRRLDPFERVEELGDASVPFAFDVHAIIYAQDAPALESALHREFANRRVNMVNTRKEYFRVSLDEIRAAVEKHHGLVTFVLSAEAEEYRKTCALATTGSPEPALPT
jgi:hypothetical protein